MRIRYVSGPWDGRVEELPRGTALRVIEVFSLNQPDVLEPEKAILLGWYRLHGNGEATWTPENDDWVACDHGVTPISNCLICTPEVRDHAGCASPRSDAP
jgi:hypothetical protein